MIVVPFLPSSSSHSKIFCTNSLWRYEAGEADIGEHCMSKNRFVISIENHLDSIHFCKQNHHRIVTLGKLKYKLLLVQCHECGELALMSSYSPPFGLYVVATHSTCAIVGTGKDLQSDDFDGDLKVK